MANLNDVNKKVEEANLTLGDFENGKRKMAAENADLLRQLQELENNANMLVKVKSQLTSQLDEAKRVADDETKERSSLLGKFKNLEHDLDGIKEQLEERAEESLHHVQNFKAPRSHRLQAIRRECIRHPKRRSVGQATPSTEPLQITSNR